MATVILDTHVLYWWAAEPDRLSPAATAGIDDADELAVAAISWYELAWLVERGRIVLAMPTRSWLMQIADYVQTTGLTPAIAATAASLPASFPRDPMDRLIYATAVENGWRLVTKDEKLHAHPYPRPVTLW